MTGIARAGLEKTIPGLSEKVGVFRSKPSEADGESRGAYFLYASTLDAGIAKGSTERHRPSSRVGPANVARRGS